MGDRVSKDEVQKANDIHILDYLQSRGEPLEKQGKYYRHTEHDSLVINENGKWFWNSKSTGGFGSISFAREFYELSFQDAVRSVNNENISKEQSEERFKTETESKKEFSYPKQYENETQTNIKSYLVNERGLNENTINKLIEDDLIAEDKLKNAVFKWKNNEGEIVGADRQGTQQMANGNYFKQIVADSKEDGGFEFDVGEPNKLAIFESPIDAISYYDLHEPENIRLKSMSGLKDRTASTSIKELFKENNDKGYAFEKVIIGVDNDEAGNKFADKWENMIGISERHSPISKDWNMDLQNHKAQERTLDRTHINHIQNELER